MNYSLSRTWPDSPDNLDDNEMRYNGQSVGRIYKTRVSAGERWHWTIHISARVRGAPDVGIAGDGLTLDDAQDQFRSSFQKLVAAGNVAIND
jgi:hypothetical protein